MNHMLTHTHERSKACLDAGCNKRAEVSVASACNARVSVCLENSLILIYYALYCKMKITML